MSECVNGSSCDESDFLTLFSEPTPLENPTPSVSWIEAEMAKMEAKDQHDSQHHEFVSLRDREMIGPSLDYISEDDVHQERLEPQTAKHRISTSLLKRQIWLLPFGKLAVPGICREERGNNQVQSMNSLPDT
ncbi:hypothetical protein AtubIFM55763_001450 [Aspergillus tubingensis]|nr:hypothetical protein AtubIFM55763_001450 [Aspergillus tubingensis]